jgi:putative phage-type endonuclease
MQISTAPQNTPEWLKARLGKFTASEIHKLIGKDANKMTQGAITYMWQKINEIAYGESKENFSNKYTEWGHVNEPLAAIEYMKQKKVLVSRVGFISNDDYGASCDRLVSTDGITEIKCSQEHHLKYCLIDTEEKLLKAEKGYYWQMQLQMLVTGRKWCDFVCFDPRRNDHLRLHTLRIYRKEFGPQNKLMRHLNTAINEKYFETIKNIIIVSKTIVLSDDHFKKVITEMEDSILAWESCINIAPVKYKNLTEREKRVKGYQAEIKELNEILKQLKL